MRPKEEIQSAILLIYCPDQKGIVATVTEFIQKHNGNILHLDQHVEPQKRIFFMRIEWDLKDFAISRDHIGEIFSSGIAEKFRMQWKLHFSGEVPRLALFVSKLSHCLYDILSRWQSKELMVEVPLIVSNHPDLEVVAKQFGIEYAHLPITGENREEQEQKQLNLLKEYEIDLIILARYMQIVSENFISHYPDRIINIHHSFLPAFPGAKPYHSAYERGVKIIGATSHYVTTELDAGPIIEQDVVRVTHRDSIGDLIRKGQDLEKVVLARAVRHHIRRNLLVFRNRAIVLG